MASLVLIKLPEHNNTSYDPWDVIDVFDANQHPGLDVAANDPLRFGFVYINDADPDVVKPWLTEAIEEANTEPGADPGDMVTVKKRRYGYDCSKINGPTHKWQTYRPYGDNRTIESTWAQAQAFVTDKLGL